MVALIVTSPTPTKVTKPFESTVAIVGSLVVYITVLPVSEVTES